MPPKKGGYQSVQSIFDEIDQAGNGYITFSGFVKWWKAKESANATSSLTDECLMSAMTEFRKADANNNGQIDAPEELYSLFTALSLDETLMQGAIEAPEPPAAEPEPEAAEEEVGGEDDEPPPPVEDPPSGEEEEWGPPPPDEPKAPEVARRVKVFYVKQRFLDEAPELVQLAVGNFSVMLMIHGRTIATFPYLTLKNWGKTPTTFWMNEVDFSDESHSTKWTVETEEGRAISDLMVIQAQEMAKKIQPGRRNQEGGVGWEDLVFDVAVHTGDVIGAGTDAEVHIEIHGAEGSSGKLVLPPALNGRSCYERAQVDSFTVKLMPAPDGTRVRRLTPDFANASKNKAYLPAGTTSLGELVSLTVGHDGAGFGAGWHVAKVSLLNMRTFEKIDFVFDRWFDAKASRDSSGADRKIVVNCPNDSGTVVRDTGAPPPPRKVKTIAKEKVLRAYRALIDHVAMREDAEGRGAKCGELVEGDIVEAFEEKEVGGKKRLRILSPANEMGWVSFAKKGGMEQLKTTTSWASFRLNPDGDGCSGWLRKKGGMRTNWTNRWFKLQGLALTYYETNKLGVGKTEKGKIDVTTVMDVCESKAPGSEGFFEIEIVTTSRTYRIRASNEPDYTAWIDQIARFAAT
jgi:hypothetical protein